MVDVEKVRFFFSPPQSNALEKQVVPSFTSLVWVFFRRLPTTSRQQTTIRERSLTGGYPSGPGYSSGYVDPGEDCLSTSHLPMSVSQLC